jgi:hypothetical protein
MSFLCCCYGEVRVLQGVIDSTINKKAISLKVFLPPFQTDVCARTPIFRALVCIVRPEGHDRARIQAGSGCYVFYSRPGSGKTTAALMVLEKLRSIVRGSEPTLLSVPLSLWLHLLAL